MNNEKHNEVLCENAANMLIPALESKLVNLILTHPTMETHDFNKLIEVQELRIAISVLKKYYH